MIVKVTSKNAIRRLPESEWRHIGGASCSQCHHPKSAIHNKKTDSWHCPLHNNKLICQNNYANENIHLLSTYICNDFKT